ncbi:MAG: PfkB family carbohydrate kinase [Planktomarina sp.]
MIIVGGDCIIDMIQSDRGNAHIAFHALRGGSSYNTALACGRQSVPTGFLTPLSTDALGQFMAQEMQNSGVKAVIPPSPLPTSLAIVTLQDGQPSYQFYRNGVADRDVDTGKLQNAMPDDATFLHVSSLGIADGADADAWADTYIQSAPHMITTLDPNIRAAFIHDRSKYMERLESMLRVTDILKLSDEDIAWIFPNLDLDAALAELTTMTSAHWVVLTLGDKGARAMVNGQRLDIPVQPATPFADSVGAGDTFMGTILAQTYLADVRSKEGLADMPIDTARRILHTAAKAAAINCTKQGCNPPWADDL